MQTTLLGTPETREQLAELQLALEDRLSTVHFARAAVTLMLAMISGGASGKLFWDAKHFPWAGIVAAVIAVGLATYAVTMYSLGRGHLRRELKLFASLQDLRRTLRMDDPSALLPQAQ